MSAELEAVRALLADEPLIVHSIRRELERTPEGRGGELHFRSNTPGIGGSGCPGDNLTRWIDQIRAAVDGPQDQGECGVGCQCSGDAEVEQ